MLSNRERKALRKRRAAIHAAIIQANTMARSKKRGTSRDTEKNMIALGFKRIGPNGAGLPIDEKWEKVDA